MRCTSATRVWNGAARDGNGAWLWKGSAEAASDEIARRLACGQSWMIYDPGDRVGTKLVEYRGRELEPGAGECWCLDVGPANLADAIIEASSAFDGVALFDMHLLTGVWGKHGPRLSLWMPLFPLLDGGFTVLNCRLSAASFDKRRRLHHRCGRHE